MPKGWLKMDEATEYIGVSRSTIYRLMQAGKLTPYRILGEGDPRFKKEDLDALMVPGGAQETSRTKGGDRMATFTAAGKTATGAQYPPGDSLIVGIGYSFPLADGTVLSTLDLMRFRGLYWPNRRAMKREMPTYVFAVRNKTLLGYARVLGMSVGAVADTLTDIAPSEQWAREERDRVVYHLAEFVPLEKNIGIWVQSHAVCDFDILWRYDTWEEMRLARKARWDRWAQLTRSEAVEDDE